MAFTGINSILETQEFRKGEQNLIEGMFMGTLESFVCDSPLIRNRQEGIRYVVDILDDELVQSEIFKQFRANEQMQGVCDIFTEDEKIMLILEVNDETQEAIVVPMFILELLRPDTKQVIFISIINGEVDETGELYPEPEGSLKLDDIMAISTQLEGINLMINNLPRYTLAISELLLKDDHIQIVIGDQDGT